MGALVQRVSEARVVVAGEVVSAIDGECVADSLARKMAVLGFSLLGVGLGDMRHVVAR